MSCRSSPKILSSSTLLYRCLYLNRHSSRSFLQAYQHNAMYSLERTRETSFDELESNGYRTDMNSDGTREDKASTKSLSRRTGKKLVLHFDLNNTILVSDAVTRQGTVAALEYFLSTVTWGCMTKGMVFIYTFSTYQTFSA